MIIRAIRSFLVEFYRRVKGERSWSVSYDAIPENKNHVTFFFVVDLSSV